MQKPEARSRHGVVQAAARVERMLDVPAQDRLHRARSTRRPPPRRPRACRGTPGCRRLADAAVAGQPRLLAENVRTRRRSAAVEPDRARRRRPARAPAPARRRRPQQVDARPEPARRQRMVRPEVVRRRARTEDEQRTLRRRGHRRMMRPGPPAPLDIPDMPPRPHERRSGVPSPSCRTSRSSSDRAHRRRHLARAQDAAAARQGVRTGRARSTARDR